MIATKYFVIQENEDGTPRFSSSCVLDRSAAYASLSSAYGVRCFVCRVETSMEPVERSPQSFGHDE
jgi:hypothetical protein